MKRSSRIKLPLFALQILAFLATYTATASTPEWKRYVVSSPEPVYPEVVKRTGMQGLGVFQLAINRHDGTVTEVKVLKSTGHKQLDAIYVMNFFQWRFQPGTVSWVRIPRGIRVLGRANIYHGAR
ncbi:MAG TPA: energy transducer TonB [Chthoniobacterales bacterium]|jgi:TonB family protein|nr:energy transducer TonB [Chthoniobacterales bacterium]